jgi:threonine aldolase
VHPCQLPNQPDGTLDLEQVRAAIRPDDPHDPISRLVALENTHNRCGGVALTPEYTRAAGELAHEHGLLLHLDGARIFNAAAALGVDAVELAAPTDSITFCLSKGLSAPVGSLICGSREFIRRALRARKQLGGGMRQVGVLAAAGIVALEEVRPRLAEDHRRARQLAAGLSAIPGLVLDPGTPQTNMVFLSLAEDTPLDAAQVAEGLLKCGVKVGVVAGRRFRLVTHYWIDDTGVERAVEGFKQVLA